MLRVSPKRYSSRIVRLAFPCAGALIFIALAPVALRAQRPKDGLDSGAGNRPAFSDFKGVSIGMRADEARKKLGSPRDKSAEQDFYFMNGAREIPSCKDVLGAEAEKKADGSVYKLIRYPKAGYWVSYSRTAGDSATVTITMQKIQ